MRSDWRIKGIPQPLVWAGYDSNAIAQDSSPLSFVIIMDEWYSIRI
jgi:hypothetical protein